MFTIDDIQGGCFSGCEWILDVLSPDGKEVACIK